MRQWPPDSTGFCHVLYRISHPEIRASLGSEHALTAISNRQATHTAWGADIALTRENPGDRLSDPIQGLGAGVRDLERKAHSKGRLERHPETRRAVRIRHIDSGIGIGADSGPFRGGSRWGLPSPMQRPFAGRGPAILSLAESRSEIEGQHRGRGVSPAAPWRNALIGVIIDPTGHSSSS